MDIPVITLNNVEITGAKCKFKHYACNAPPRNII